jgi:sugar/nucleoside kinase (ribokinase family)
LAKVVVVKRSSAAAICRSGEQQWSLLPPTVKMVDDVGAGALHSSMFVVHRSRTA